MSGRTRRSRLGWADPMDEEPPPPAAHTHRLPSSVRTALIGLTAATMLLLVAVSLMSVYVYQQQQYVQGRGELRDRETARLEEQIRSSICDLLDQLPEGGLLDRPRLKYGCGPGIPLDLLTPEEQARVAGGRPTPAAPVPSVPVPTTGSPAVPNVERPEPTPVPPRTGPGPDDPPPEPRPITDLVCDLAGVCI